MMVVIPLAFFSGAVNPLRIPMFIMDGLFVSLRELSACENSLIPFNGQT